MASQNYWNERAVILSESLLKRGDDFNLALGSAYELAKSRIRKEIDAFYNRFAVDNKVTYAQAKKLLTSDERRGFVMDVQDYIERAKKTPYSPEWALKLENASTVHRVTRLEYLNFQMRQQAEEVYSLFDRDMKGLVSETYEDGYYRSLYEAERAESKDMPFAKLDTETVKQVINKPWTPDGTNFSDKIWKDRDALVNYLHTELTQAFIRGESADRLIKDVRKRFDVSSRNAARLIQTEMAFFSAMAKKESYKALGYKKYIIVAALDEKTSQICREMNGEVFDVDDFQPGVTANPFHPRCRSTTAPYMEKDDGQTGPGMVKDPKTGEMTAIPKDKSYREWLNERLAEAGSAEPVSLEDAPVNEPILIDTITPDEVDKKLREYENIIKDNDFETAFVIDGNGDVYRVKGEKDSVDWDGVSGKDAYILHNHPLNANGYADSFSTTDYAYMQATQDFKEMRLVTPTHRYTLRLLKPLDLSRNEVYLNGAALAYAAGATNQIHHYMMLYLKELGYADYAREAIN